MNQIRAHVRTNPGRFFINKVYREVNSTADFVAELAHTLSHGLRILHDPPAGCHFIIWNVLEEHLFLGLCLVLVYSHS